MKPTRLPALLLVCLRVGLVQAADYHLDAVSGDDSRDGRTPTTAWRTIERANSAVLRPGDQLLLRANQTFRGTLRLEPDDAGTPEQPVVVRSFGEGRATIEAGLGYAVLVENAGGVEVRDLICAGADRTRNRGAGVAFVNTLPGNRKLRHVRIRNVEARGFGRELPKPKSLPEGYQLPQGAGILVAGNASDNSKSGFEDVEITGCSAHDNAYYGILITGAWDAKATHYANSGVRILDCSVFENPGDPLYHENHSGSGILVEDCDGGLVDRCVAFENGALCNDAPGGPCGIWTAVARRVVIQNCESFRNRTQTGDGDGFDLDGGCIECALQYNYSHDNDGAGFLVYTYADAPHEDRGNIVRWNVSENDARRNRQYGGLCLGNSGDGMSGVQVYHNTVIMSRTNDLADCVVAVEAPGIGASFWNNVLLGACGVPLVRLAEEHGTVSFQGNVYGGAHSDLARIGHRVVKNLDAWRSLGMERSGQGATGRWIEPALDLAAPRGTAGDLARLSSLNAFRPPPGRVEHFEGVDLKAGFGVEIGRRDWSGRPLGEGPVNTAGALAPGLRALPYPASQVLSGLEWTSEPHVYPGIHSDMHWQTWGADDAVWCVDGDGIFPGTQDYYGSLSRITGTPTNHSIELVTQFRDLRIREDHTPDGMRRYFCGPLAVGTNLYVCLYDYDWRIPGRNVTNKQDFLAVDRYSKLGGTPGILVSHDGGKSWSNVPGKEAPRFLGPNFGNLQFIGFGPGYTRVPPEFGDYVYAISNDSNWESGDQLFLTRVHRDRVLDCAAWEFFSGTADAPAWAQDEASAKPVFLDPGHAGHSDMTYVPGLKRFLLSVFSDTVPHRENASFEETQRWERHTELQVYESPSPWGPWSLVYREEPWGGADHACYLPHLPAKWLDADGLGGWMLYSGDWEGSHYPKQPYYGYVTRRFRLLPAEAAPAGVWHVAPGGDDAGRGTRDRPVASLKRAVELARQAGSGSSRRIVVHGGEYYGVVVSLGPEDNGLILEAAPGQQPVLYGGESLAGLRPVEGPLVAAQVSNGATANGARMLLVNGRFAPRARFPAQGTLQHRSEFNVRWLGTYGGGWERKPTTDDLTTLRVDASTLGQHFEPANAELTIFHEWDESAVGVRSFDADAGMIRFSNETGHPPGAFGNRSFVVWNTRDGMTMPGQWMFDRSRGRILYWPLPGEDPARLSVVIPTTEAILRLEGTATRPVRDITIRGLVFSVANTPLRTGGFGAYAFEGAITGEHMQRCRFLDLNIRQVGGNGIKLSHASDCRIEACDIGTMGAGGVLCQDGAALEIANNRIHHVGLAYPSGIGLTCTGTSNLVSGNFVHDATYVGITCDGGFARVESNRIEQVMLELHDGAGIYLGGTNHLIRGNLCRDIGRSTTDRRHAYYMDELMRGSRLEGNLALQCPSPLHNHIASDIDIVNNVFIHDGDLRLSFFRCDTHRLEHNLVAAGGAIEVYRPEAISQWSGNVFFSRTGTVTGRPVERYDPGEPFPLRNSGIVSGEDPGLQTNAEGQVSWSKSSPAARAGIRPLDLRATARNVGR